MLNFKVYCTPWIDYVDEDKFYEKYRVWYFVSDTKKYQRYECVLDGKTNSIKDKWVEIFNKGLPKSALPVKNVNIFDMPACKEVLDMLVPKTSPPKITFDQMKRIKL